MKAKTICCPCFFVSVRSFSSSISFRNALAPKSSALGAVSTRQCVTTTFPLYEVFGDTSRWNVSFLRWFFSLSPAMLEWKVSSERICFLRFDSRKEEKARKSARTSHGLPSGKCFPLPSEATHTVTGDVGRWCWWCRAFFLLWSFLIHSGRWLMVRKWLQRKKPTRCCKSFPLGLGRMDGWGSQRGDNNIEITFFSLLLLLKCFPNLLLVVCAGAAFPFRLLLLYAGLSVETVNVCGGKKVISFLQNILLIWKKVKYFWCVDGYAKQTKGTAGVSMYEYVKIYCHPSAWSVFGIFAIKFV